MASSFRTGGGEAGPLAPKELVQLAEDLFTSFEPARLTVDSHTEEFFLKRRVCEGDRVFAEQVLYGCTRYKRLLDAFIAALYFHESANLLRTDRAMYTCYAYLALLRLDDLTFPQFRRLLFANDPQKMLCFIQFTFDSQLLHELCRDEWLKIYDSEYVDALILQVTAYDDEVQEVIHKLDAKVTLAKQKEDEEAAAWQKSGYTAGTVPVPFNLTISKPRLLPQVEELPPPIKARPAPPRRSGPTTEEKAIQAALEENKKRKEALISESRPFHLRVLERPSNLEQVRAELEERRRQEETYGPAPPRPVPPPPAADVKYNTAAILREEFLYRQRAEKEARALKNAEEALNDGADYEIWRIDQKAAEEAARAAEAERKREEARAAEEASKRAREAAAERNAHVAEQQREEARLAAELLKEQREKEKELNVIKKEKVVAARSNVQAVKEKTAEERKAHAEEQTRQRADNEARRALEQEEERRRKAELVRQIREMQQAAAAARGEKSQVDVTAQASNLGLMEAMSLQELRERLAAVTEEQRREEEARRERILAERSAKDESILQKAARLQRMREQNKQVAAVRRARQAQALATASKAAQARVEAGAEGAFARLQDKRAKTAARDARFAEELAAVHARVGALATGAERAEILQNKGIRDAAERVARDSQRKAAQEAAMRVLVSAQAHRRGPPREAGPLRAATAGAGGTGRRPESKRLGGTQSGSPAPGMIVGVSSEELAAGPELADELAAEAGAGLEASAGSAGAPPPGSAGAGGGAAAGGERRQPTTPQMMQPGGVPAVVV